MNLSLSHVDLFYSLFSVMIAGFGEQFSLCNPIGERDDELELEDSNQLLLW